MSETSKNEPAASFAPVLYLDNVAAAIDFYIAALGVTEIQRWINDDGSIHVVELSVAGAVFHVHEPTLRNRNFSPSTLDGTPVVLGLFTADPDALMAQAIAAGVQVIAPMQNYDYGYRQGDFRDPFGHHWVLQKRLT